MEWSSRQGNERRSKISKCLLDSIIDDLNMFVLDIRKSWKENCKQVKWTWHSLIKAFGVALLLTFFSAFDVPVFWPILMFYWSVLFFLTMRRQIMHMIKYKYVPFTFGKQVCPQSIHCYKLSTKSVLIV
ncbi:hypothetical protein SASPL_115589 [Salvia splendens]|uniref:Protein RER1 n=1 Tax=Salvia splendens TaxID=180675 RepID=A0A8X8Y8B4_SALSN|nr:hypothetical protein SASPL_115589 [Salvia splendens]